MIGVPREFENVPLGDAHVLQHLPSGVGKTGNALSAFLDRKPFDEIVKGHVGVTAIEQRQQLFAQRLVVGLIHWFFLSALSLWERIRVRVLEMESVPGAIGFRLTQQARRPSGTRGRQRSRY